MWGQSPNFDNSQLTAPAGPIYLYCSNFYYLHSDKRPPHPLFFHFPAKMSSHLCTKWHAVLYFTSILLIKICTYHLHSCSALCILDNPKSTNPQPFPHSIWTTVDGKLDSRLYRKIMCKSLLKTEKKLQWHMCLLFAKSAPIKAKHLKVVAVAQ